MVHFVARRRDRAPHKPGSAGARNPSRFDSFPNADSHRWRLLPSTTGYTTALGRFLPAGTGLLHCASRFRSRSISMAELVSSGFQPARPCVPWLADEIDRCFLDNELSLGPWRRLWTSAGHAALQ